MLTIDDVANLNIDNNGEQQQQNDAMNNNNNNDIGNDLNTNTILIQMQQMRQSMIVSFDTVQQQQNNMRMEMLEKHKILTKNINRIFIQPPRMGSQQQRLDREVHNNFEEAVEALV